jgi:hypothetical protein
VAACIAAPAEVAKSSMRREDSRTGKRAHGAMKLFVAAVLLACGALAWTVLSAGEKGGVAGRPQSLLLVGSAPLVLAAAVNLYFAYGGLWWWYRCPTCRAKVPRVRGEGMRLRYRCGKCRIDWDTGWDDVPEGD